MKRRLPSRVAGDHVRREVSLRLSQAGYVVTLRFTPGYARTIARRLLTTADRVEIVAAASRKEAAK